MKALILAAGLSSRLRPLTEEIPKTLLPLDERVMLEHIMDAVRTAGITHFNFVTGHGRDHVLAFLRDYQSRHPEITYEYVFMDRYATTGNIMWINGTKHLFDDDVIVINSDTIFHPYIVQKLVKSDERNAMVVDDFKTLGEEEMKVLVDDDHHIYRIHKTLDPGEAHGEYIGVLKLSKDIKQILIDSSNALTAEDETLYYEDAIQRMLDDHDVRLAALSTDEYPAMEIDTHEDLEEARLLIPRIRE